MYRGLFLNLDRNEKRRESLTRHLADLGLSARYQRFPAVDGRAVAAQYPTMLDPGNLGLWLSHERIAQAHGSGDAHLHILEDDAILARDAVPIFERALAQADAQLGGWDLIFTDVLVPLNTDVFRLFADKVWTYTRSRQYVLLDLAQINFACTSSLFLNRFSIGKYASLLAGGWSLGLPIDLYLRQLVHEGRLKAYVTVPFMTSVSRDSLDSDIRGSVEGSRRVCEVLRRAFFQEADWHALSAEMSELTQGAAIPPLAALYLQAEGFSMSDQWVPF
jgi:hypothetical protein